MKTLELVLLVGLPGAGKSTFYRERFTETHALVSKDLMPRSANKARRQREQIATALDEGRSVVVDNLNASRAERAEAIAVAKPYDAKVIVYRFAESVADCRKRNAAREGEARVPLVAIYAAAKRFEELSESEGIGEIHIVRLNGSGFEIEA